MTAKIITYQKSVSSTFNNVSMVRLFVSHYLSVLVCVFHPYPSSPFCWSSGLPQSVLAFGHMRDGNERIPPVRSIGLRAAPPTLGLTGRSSRTTLGYVEHTRAYKNCCYHSLFPRERVCLLDSWSSSASALPFVSLLGFRFLGSRARESPIITPNGPRPKTPRLRLAIARVCGPLPCYLTLPFLTALACLCLASLS